MQLPKYVSLLLVGALAVGSSSANAALVLLHDQDEVVNPVAASAPVTCDRAEIDAVCGGSPDARSDLMFSGVVNKLTCLTENKARLSDACFFLEMDNTLDFIVEKQGSKCKDELRSKCGKQIDALKKAIQNTEVIGTIKGAVDVAQCIVSHAEDLWDHCKPQKQEMPALQEVTLLDNCDTRTFALCPPTQHKVLGLGFTLGCLADKSNELGMDCTRDQIVLALEEMENSDDKKCHEELRSKCGKQIDALKKAIQQTSVLGIVKGAVDVVQCVAQNAEDLWHHCTPFDEEDSDSNDVVVTAGAPTPPTRKPTHKPTHKPTKAPTKKPTPKPTEKTQKPTAKPTGTARPTPKKIADAFADDAMKLMMMDNEPEEDNMFSDDEFDLEGRRHHRGDHHHEHHHEHHHGHHHHRHHGHHGHGGMDGAEADMVVTEVAVDFDMDLCVKSARKYCEKEVITFNDSPFDVRALQTLNFCIEANAAKIEAECAVASSATYTSYFSDFLANFHPRPAVHPPCRHPEDHLSNLPICKRPHRCGGKHAFWIGLGIAVFLLVTIKLSVVAYRRRQACCKAKAAKQAEQRTVDGIAYEPLKDDIRIAPSNNLV